MTDIYSGDLAPDGAPVTPGWANPKGKRVREPMSEERFGSIVHEAISDAESYVDDDLAGDRTKATEHYYGKPEVQYSPPGRSSIVMTEVHDVVSMMMPGIMRVFSGNQRVVEFEPVSEEDIEAAEQATQYIDHVFMRDNPGFRLLHDAALDGLVRKTGIFKWYYEKTEEVVDEEYTGLSLDDVRFLANDPDVEIIDMQPEESGSGGYANEPLLSQAGY